MKLRLSFLAILLILFVPGCGGNSPGVGVQSTGWTINESGSVPVKGLDDAQVLIGHIGGDPAVIVWADCSGSFGGQFTNPGAASFNGTLRAPDGREVNLAMKIPSGQTSNVAIDGQMFDPANGKFFLVSTANGKTRVEQLKRTLPASLLNDKSEDRSAAFRRFAKGDSEITAFYATDEPDIPSAAADSSAKPGVTH